MSFIPEKGQIIYNTKDNTIKIGDGVNAENSLSHVNFKIVRGKFDDYKEHIFGENEAFLNTDNSTLYFGDGVTELQHISPVLSGQALNSQISTNDEFGDMLNEVFA